MGHNLRSRRSSFQAGTLEPAESGLNPKVLLGHVADHHGFPVDGHWANDPDGWTYLEWPHYVVARNSGYHGDALEGAEGTLSLRLNNHGKENMTVRWYLEVKGVLNELRDISALEPKETP